MISSVSPRADQGQRKLAVSYREAAAALGVCERSVWGLVRDGKLSAIRIGRSVRVPVAELERFVATQQG
ncbi:helix-turn-helix domain-containing protein [bacterium]|nr:helix-turn-helix domain-containing protein [bacterium]